MTTDMSKDEGIGDSATAMIGCSARSVFHGRPEMVNRVAIKVMRACFLPFILAGCMSSDQQVFGAIDHNNKTVTVPAGNSPLVGELKKRLRKAGWYLAVDRGPRKTEGTVGETMSIETYQTFNTRYRLSIDAYQYDICIFNGAAIDYDLSLIDNVTGQEIIAQSGRDCESSAAGKFMSALTGKK